MVGALRHRGPDSEGVHHFGRCTLGAARLSIVDVAGGAQPILSPDGALGVAFNGAIYGFREIRKSLPAYRFRTDTDTEVILALYAEHGDALLDHLPGMFGFALWDERRRQLLCARDRFGEKPVYYAFGARQEFIVASEIKAILRSGLVDPVLNPEAVSHYLARLHVHPAQTIYTNIHALPPAHRLRFSAGVLRIERYWQPPDAVETMAMPAAVERFRELFDAAVRKQLTADVPVGVLLSGGVDSSTVAAVASRCRPGVRTFSFGFAEGVESELPAARTSAALYGSPHFEMTDDAADPAELLLRMQTIYDEPFGDSSAIPTFLICELARKQVTVVLGGDGADELLGGYLFWSRHILDSQDDAPKAPGAGSPLVHRYAQEFRNTFPAEERRGLGVHASADHLIDYARYRQGTPDDMLRFDTELYLPGDVLVKTDRAAMANGLELRAPFLDVDVASFCLSLPDALKVDDQQEKLLLRRAYGHAWTPDVRSRRKQGFGGPRQAWLRRPTMQRLKHAALCERGRRIFSLLDYDAVQDYVAQDTQQTWSLLVLSLWLETHACSLPAN
jgi:asparagine synthase (glutamine-hydrolysing)